MSPEMVAKPGPRRNVSSTLRFPDRVETAYNSDTWTDVHV